MNFMFLAAAPTEGVGIGTMLLQMSPLLLVFVLMYFIMIRPQKKKEKAATEMRNAIEVGDGVTTIGGIVGRVASIKEDVFVLETGTDRVKMRFKRWAIQDVEKLNIETPAATPASTETK
ncbi:MAG: preprotein translocase subunit YajC [Oscillospiraceae bacterium]